LQNCLFIVDIHDLNNIQNIQNIQFCSVLARRFEQVNGGQSLSLRWLGRFRIAE